MNCISYTTLYTEHWFEINIDSKTKEFDRNRKVTTWVIGTWHLSTWVVTTTCRVSKDKLFFDVYWLIMSCIVDIHWIYTGIHHIYMIVELLRKKRHNFWKYTVKRQWIGQWPGSVWLYRCSDNKLCTFINIHSDIAQDIDIEII